MRELDILLKNQQLEGHKFYYKIEQELLKQYKQLLNYTSSYHKIQDQRAALLEQMGAVRLVEELVPSDFQTLMYNDHYNEGIRFGRGTRYDKKFHSSLGLIPTIKLHQVQKVLFRISRENIILKSRTLNELHDPLLRDKGSIPQKTLIFVLFPRTEQEVIVQKVNSILKSFEFVSLDLPPHGQKPDILLTLRENLEDNRKILTKTENEINIILQGFSKPAMIPWLSYINVLRLVIQREHNFAKNLTYIEEKGEFYQLLIWVPVSNIDELRTDLEEIRMSDTTFAKPKLIELDRGKSVHTSYKPPTFFHHNDFTRAFQLIVDTYGVPRYKEANPGLFTIITFPFMFGVMFGDIGHGLLLIATSLFIMFVVGKNNNMLYSARYLILLMGIFSTFCGFIYNDFFSVPLILFDSCYSSPGDPGVPFKRVPRDCTYPIGIDWIWAQSSNDTTFVNSFKMKFSIIVGVIQMLSGTLLKGLNSIYFNSGVDLWFEAIPQFIFMSVTFGYMGFCIIVKWLQNWENRQTISIIQLFINFTSVKEALYSTPELQEKIQTTFLIIAVACVLLMLIPKPLILYFRTPSDKSFSRIYSEESDIEQKSKLMGAVS